jgi:hypothetical protein
VPITKTRAGGIEQRDQQRARLDHRELVQPFRGGQRALDLEHDVGIAQRLRLFRRDHCPHRPEGVVRDRGTQSGAGLDHHIETKGNQLFDRIGRHRDAPFMRAPLLRNGQLHQAGTSLSVTR